MKKIFVSVLVALVMCLSLFALPACAAEGQKLDVAMYDDATAVVGVKFHLYRIGSYSDGRINPESPFDSYSVLYDVEDTEQMQSLALTLSGYILRDDIVSDYDGITDSYGVADFGGVFIDEGVYVLMAEKHHQDVTTYFVEPTLIVLPYGEDDTFAVYPKFTSVDDGTKNITVSYRVLKAWVEDEGVTRPVEVGVELLRDGEVYDTVTLDESNNWSYEWHDLSVFYHWTVVEKWVSEGYRVMLTQDQKTLMLTNSGSGVEPTTEPEETTKPQDTTKPGTTKPGTTKPDGDKLPATGSLQWPIPMLVIAGLLLVTLGYAKYRKSELKDE